MKQSVNSQSGFPLALAVLSLITTAGMAPPVQAGSVGRVSVTEVDEVRDAAAISRAKAHHRSQSSGEDSAGFSSSGGCSDLNIGNVNPSVGQRAPRNVIVVVEGPVIQENNCR